MVASELTEILCVLDHLVPGGFRAGAGRLRVGAGRFRVVPGGAGWCRAVPGGRGVVAGGCRAPGPWSGWPGMGAAHDEGPRGTSAAGPFVGQHRRQGSTGAWEAAPGGCAAGLPRYVVARRHGRTRWRRRGLGSLRIVLDGKRPPQPLDPGRDGSRRPAPGVPEPAVLLGDRAAVPCRPVTSLERGPTTHGTIRASHRSSEPRVVLSGPRLADTDTGTNEAVRAPVTRRTGERRPELRCDRGTAPAASSPAPCPACPGPGGSGRGSPSRARGSRAGRRT